VVKRLLVALILFTAAGCSSDGHAPDVACASPPPGETLTECKDHGEGEGPMRG
jgi:hypothetical protein